MRWIELESGGLVNLEQVCSICIVEGSFNNEPPETCNVVYTFHSKDAVYERFDTKAEAEGRLRYLSDCLGVSSYLEKVAKNACDAFFSELQKLTEELAED